MERKEKKRTSVGVDVGKLKPLCIAIGNRVYPLWTIVWWFLKTLNRELPFDPGISLLGIHTKELKVGS